jgi:hypothetical protein
MRLLNNRKGQVRVIEAFFASIMLMSCLTLIPAQTTVKTQTGNLAARAVFCTSHRLDTYLYGKYYNSMSL